MNPDLEPKRTVLESDEGDGSKLFSWNTKGKKIKDLDIIPWNITSSLDEVPLDADLVWLLFLLLVSMIWFTYIFYYNSRLFGYVLTKIVNHFVIPKYLFPNTKRSSLPHFSIGSISISAISGKVMFRDMIYVTPDFSVRIQDGWLIYKWWIPYKPKDIRKSDFSHHDARISVLLNGFELHIYNRSQLYANLQKTFGIYPHKVYPDDSADSEEKSSNVDDAFKFITSEDLVKLYLWRDFFPVTKFEIVSGRFVFGNPLVPSTLLFSFEEAHITYTSRPAISPHDLFTHIMKCKADSFKIVLAPSPKYLGLIDEPPRFMGDGLVVFQSNSIDFYYYQDEPGLMSEEPEKIELPTGDVVERFTSPAWGLDVKCGKGTDFSYGPWADRQRELLYKVFYPADYQHVEATSRPKEGEKRIFESFEFRLSTLADAKIDILFTNKEKETNALHINAGPGSYLEVSVPYIAKEDGYSSRIVGQILHLDATTILNYRSLAESETLEFSVQIHYPLIWNHHQTWTCNIIGCKATVCLIYAHKEFFHGLIEDWAGKARPDILQFVPYTWKFNLVLKEFELITMATEYNWIDCSSLLGSENVQLAVCGDTFDLSFDLPFTDFLPTKLPIKIWIQGESVDAAMYLPEANPYHDVIFMLDQHAKLSRSFLNSCDLGAPHKTIRTSELFPTEKKWRNIVKKSNGWIDCWSVPIVALSIIYHYHPVPPKASFPKESEITTPEKEEILLEPIRPDSVSAATAKKCTPPDDFDPALMDPDLIELELEVGPSTLCLYGSLFRILWDLKENYLGESQTFNDFTANPNLSVLENLSNQAKERPVFGNISAFDHHLKPFDARLYRPLDVTVSVIMHDIHGHVMKSCTEGDPPCPQVYLEKLCFEMHKAYRETKLQLLLSPILVKTVDQVARPEPHAHLDEGHLVLSSLQFRGHAMFSGLHRPLESETLEYAWLVEVHLGRIFGKVTLPQMHHVVSGLEILILQALQEDCSLQPPVPYQKCVHDVIQSQCVESDKLNNRFCPYPEDLKYRMVRLSVAAVDLCFVETNNAINVQIMPIKFSTCNLHSCRASSGITVLIEKIILKHFIMINNSSASWKGSKLQLAPQANDKEHYWLEVLGIDLGPLFLDSATLVSVSETSVVSQTAFLKAHDKKTRRLWFLWSDEVKARNLDEKCGCVGGCVFFGLNSNGLTYFNVSNKQYDTRNLFSNRQGPDLGFGESLLNPKESLLGLQSEDDTDIEDELSSINLMSLIDRRNVPTAPLSPVSKSSASATSEDKRKSLSILSRAKGTKSMFSRQMSSPARSSPFTINTPISTTNVSEPLSMSPSSTAPAHLHSTENRITRHTRNRSLSESGTEDAENKLMSELSEQRSSKKCVEFKHTLEAPPVEVSRQKSLESQSTATEPYFSAEEGSSNSSNSESLTLRSATSNMPVSIAVSDDTFKSVQSMSGQAATDSIASNTVSRSQGLSKSYVSLRSTYSAPPCGGSSVGGQAADTQSLSSASFISAVSSQEDGEIPALVDLRNQMEKPIIDSPLLMCSYSNHLTHFSCKNWVSGGNRSTSEPPGMAMKNRKHVPKFVQASAYGFSCLKVIPKKTNNAEEAQFRARFGSVVDSPGCVYTRIKPAPDDDECKTKDERHKTKKEEESDITQTFEVRNEKVTVLVKLTGNTDIRISPLSLDGLRMFIDALTPTLVSLHPLTIINHLSLLCSNKVEAKNQLKKEKMLQFGQFKLKAWRTTLERERNLQKNNTSMVPNIAKSRFGDAFPHKEQNSYRNQSTMAANRFEQDRSTTLQTFIQVKNINIIVLQASLVEEVITFSALDNIKDITCVSLLTVSVNNIDFDFHNSRREKRSLHTFVNTSPVRTPPTSAFASFAQHELVSRLFFRKPKKEKAEIEPLTVETHELLAQETAGTCNVGAFHAQLSRLSNSSSILKEAVLTVVPDFHSKVNFQLERVEYLDSDATLLQPKNSVRSRPSFRRQDCLKDSEWEGGHDGHRKYSSDCDEAAALLTGFIMFECGLEEIDFRSVKNNSKIGTTSASRASNEKAKLDAVHDVMERKGTSFVCEVGVVWFNFAAPPKTPITRKIDFTKLDWHLLSTATPSINAWLTIGDRFVVCTKKLCHLYEQRLSSVVASLMTTALEVQGIHVPPQSKHLSRKLTPNAKALQEDPSCQLMAVLRRYVKQAKSIEDIEDNLKPEFLPSVTDLKRGIVALSRQWKNALYMPLLAEQNVKLTSGDRGPNLYHSGIPLKLLFGETVKPMEEVQVQFPLSPDTQDETENDDENANLLPDGQCPSRNPDGKNGISNPFLSRNKQRSSSASSQGEKSSGVKRENAEYGSGNAGTATRKSVPSFIPKSSRGSIAFPLLNNPLESLGSGVNRACGFLFSPNSQNSALKIKRNESQQSLKSTGTSVSSIEGNTSGEPFFSTRYDTADYNEENLYLWMARQQDYVEERTLQSSLRRISAPRNTEYEMQCNTLASANSDEGNVVAGDVASTIPPGFAFLPTSVQLGDVRVIFEPLLCSLSIEILSEETDSSLGFAHLGPNVSICGSVKMLKVDIVESESKEENLDLGPPSPAQNRPTSHHSVNFQKPVGTGSPVTADGSAFLCKSLTVDVDLRKVKDFKVGDAHDPATSGTNLAASADTSSNPPVTTEEKVPIVIVGPEGGISEVTTVVNFNVDVHHIIQRVNLPLLRLLHQFTSMYENIIEARLEMKASRLQEWKEDVHFKQLSETLMHDIGTLNETETQSATPSTASFQPNSKSKEDVVKDQVSVSMTGDVESDTTLVEEVICNPPKEDAVQPKCWKTMRYLLDLYETTPETKTVTERVSAQIPDTKIQIEDDDESNQKSKGGYEQLKDYAIEMEELHGKGGPPPRNNVSFNLHSSQKKSMINIVSSDQLKTYTHALIHRELTPLVVFGVVRIRKINLVAMLSGLKLDGELASFHVSLTHKEKVRGAAVHSRKWKESSLTGQLGQTAIALLEEIPQNMQLVVKMTIGKSQTLLSSQSKKAKDANSALLTIGAVNINIPQHPVALHGMVTRSSRQLSTTLQELRSSRQASRSSRQMESEATISAPIISQTQIHNTPKEQFYRRVIREQTMMSEDMLGGSRSKLIRPIVVQFSVILDSFTIGASLLPSLRAQYHIGQITSSGISGTKAKFIVDIREHNLSFNTLVPASESNLPSAASVSLPQIHVSAEYMEDPLKKGGTGRSESFAEGIVLRKGSFLNALADIGAFEHSLTTDLLNHLLLVQKVFMKEVNEVVQKMSGADMKMVNSDYSETEKSGNESSSGDASKNYQSSKKRRYLLFTLHLRLKGIQITATTPTNSAVRLETGVMELQLSNRVQNMLTSARNIPDLNLKMFIKLQVDLNVALGQLIKNPLFEEAEPEFQQLAYFKTRIVMRNALQDEFVSSTNSAEDKEAVLITLKRPLIYIQPLALDKAVLVWLNYKNAYEYWNEQRANLNKEVVSATQQLLGKVQPMTQFSSQTLGTVFLQLTVDDLGICLPITPPANFQSSITFTNKINYDAELKSALVVTLESTRISACSCGSLVSKAKFTGLCFRFADDFETSLDDWKPDPNDLSVMNLCIVSEGTYEICSRTTTVHQSSGHSGVSPNAEAKWFLNVSWKMEGFDIHVDTSIGKQFSALFKTLTALAGDEDDVDTIDYSSVVGDTSGICVNGEGVTTRNSSTSPVVGEEPAPVGLRKGSLFKDNSLDTKKRSRLIEKELNEQAKIINDLRQLGASQSTIEQEIKRLHELESAVFNDFKRDVIKKLRRQSLKKQTTIRDKVSPPVKSPSELKKTPEEVFEIEDDIVFNGSGLRKSSVHQESEAGSPTTPEHCRSLVLDASDDTEKRDSSVSSQQGLGSETASVLGGTTPKQNVQEPNIDFELDVQVFFSSGKCVFHTRDTSKDKEEDGARRNGLPKDRSFMGNPYDQVPSSPSNSKYYFKPGGSIHKPSASGLKANLSSSRLKYPSGASSGGAPNILDYTVFLIPGLDIMLHYTSKTVPSSTQTQTSMGSLSAPCVSLPKLKETEVQNFSTRKAGTKKASCYAWMTLHSIPEETIITPHILDFLEQALEPIPIVVSPPGKTPSPTTDVDQANASNLCSNNDTRPEMITSAPAQYAVYGSFPVDVIVYLHVQPSILRFSCLPVSRVECLLQLPSVDLVFSSKRLQDELMDLSALAMKPPIPPAQGKPPLKATHKRSGSDFRWHQQHAAETYIGGLSVTGCLADFSLYIFHPYGGQKKTAGSTLNVGSHYSDAPASTPTSRLSSDRKDSLSLQVEFVKINISRSRRLFFPPELMLSGKHGSLQDKQTVSIRFSALMDVGSASFKYDMRRLTEILAFPKAWYRKALWKRMFLGDQTMSSVFSDQEDHVDNDSSTSSSNENLDDVLQRKARVRNTPPATQKMLIKRQETVNRESLWLNLQDISGVKSTPADKSLPSELSTQQQQRQLMNRPWETLILFGVKLSKLTVHMNMGNVMGNTSWLTRGFCSDGRISIDSSGHKSFNIGLGLDGSSLDAKGGIVGGTVEIGRIHTVLKVKEHYGKEPQHLVTLKLESFEKRLDYMGTSILMVRCSDLDLMLRDEWKIDSSSKQEVFDHPTKRPALIFIHCVLHWDQLQVLMSKSTTPDIMKIIARLEEFFSQQFHSSKRVFSSLQPSKSFSRQSLKGRTVKAKPAPASNNADASSVTTEARHHRHWQKVLRLASGSKLCTISHALPAHGTILGGTFELSGKHISLACFYGVNFRSKSWGLFSLRQPNISFATEAQDIVNDSGEVDTHIIQNFSFSLGRRSEDGFDFYAQHASMANICRISRSVMFPPQFRQIHEWFQYAFSTSELDEVNRFPIIEFDRSDGVLSSATPTFEPSQRRISVSPKSSEFHHNQEVIFAFPSFQLEFKTEHLQGPRTPSASDAKPVVDCTFVTEFDDHIFVAVDAEAYFFLHELITSYIREKDLNYGKTQSPAASERVQKSVKTETSTDEVMEKDWREFICHTWHLEPTVRLLTWAGKNIEPYGVDYILQRLGFHQARTTIPKWIQRGAMDPLDKVLSLVMLHVISAIKLEQNLV